MKASELRAKTHEDIVKELSALLKEKFNLNMQRSGVVSEMKTHNIARVRKDMARVLTVLNEMEK